MSSYRIPRTEKNAIFAYIEAIGLEPLDFEWSEYVKGNERGEQLRHLPTGSVTTAIPSHAELWCTWEPAIRGKRFDHVALDGSVVVTTKQWLDRVRIEHEAPDLWAQLRAERSALTTTGIGDDSTTFSVAERQLLAERLDAVEARIVSIAGASASADQRHYIHDVLEEAKSASARMTKKDWKLYFLGIVTNVLMSLTLDPSKAREVLHYVAITIGPLISRVHGLIG